MTLFSLKKDDSFLLLAKNLHGIVYLVAFDSFNADLKNNLIKKNFTKCLL